MTSDGHKICVFILLIFLILIGIGIYYRKEIQEAFDDSPQFIYRNEIPINAYLIKKYYKPNTFLHNKMTIHMANDLNGSELYRINWKQSINMTLTRIKDGYIVSRAQRIDRSTYSFQLFGRSMTTGMIIKQETSQANFDIKYTSNHETFNIFLRNCKTEMKLFFTSFQWSTIWIDMTSRFVTNSNGRINIERINLSQNAYLEDRSTNDFDPVFGPASYPYVYNLYVQRHLPNELYLTTLIISDHTSYNNCD